MPGPRVCCTLPGSAPWANSLGSVSVTVPGPCRAPRVGSGGVISLSTQEFLPKGPAEMALCWGFRVGATPMCRHGNMSERGGPARPGHRGARAGGCGCGGATWVTSTQCGGDSGTPQAHDLTPVPVAA